MTPHLDCLQKLPCQKVLLHVRTSGLEQYVQAPSLQILPCPSVLWCCTMIAELPGLSQAEIFFS